MSNCRSDDAHREILLDWLKRYRPDDLFDESGRLKPELRAIAPTGQKRMSANPHANGGILRKELVLPAIADHAIAVDVGERAP